MTMRANRHTTIRGNRRAARGTGARASRRGVASILAMLFLAVFGALAAAMAVVSQGNVRAADSALRVMRAQGAAESGLVFAANRLERESRRFVVSRGVVDAGFADRLWNGTWSLADGTVAVEAAQGYTEETAPAGLAAALRNAHGADGSAFAPLEEHEDLPLLANGRLVTRPLRLEAGVDTSWVQLVYERVAGTPNIRVTSIGADLEVRRSISMEFRMGKRIEYAVLSANRVMIGKNVLVEGPLGTRYGTETGELTAENGDPLHMRSDFRFLSPTLTTRIDLFAERVAANDADGDGRLRPGHSSESAGLSTDFTDNDGDGFVDEFDLFLDEYDLNSDGRVVWDAGRAAAAGLGGLAVEFDGVDDQLARLIDLAVPDRDGDGVVDARDVAMGFSDGVLDRLDRYGKVHGTLGFAVSRDGWEAVAGESWQRIAQGPIRPAPDTPPVRFEVPANELREITTADFADSAAWFSTNVTGNFASAVTAGITGGGTFTPTASAPFEPVPFGSTTAYDFYQRPIYEDMTFTNVRIPTGTNALFRNCTFIGTVYIATESACTDMNWNYAGSLKQVGSGPTATYALRFPSVTASFGANTLTDTRTHSNSIRFDGCTFLGAIAGDTPQEYTHWRNKIQITGATRFFSDPNDPEIDLQPDGATLRAQLLTLGADMLDRVQRSSMMLPGWSVDVGNFSNEVDADPDLTARVRLRGTIIAGIIDIRGTADVVGTLLTTFRPVEGAGPLSYNGQSEAFNTTIGYFGAADGDGEGALPGDAGFAGFGEIRLRYDPEARLPDGVPWPIFVEPLPNSYREGGAA